MQTKRGFVSLGLILLLVLGLAAFGGAGWYVSEQSSVEQGVETAASTTPVAQTDTQPEQSVDTQANQSTMTITGTFQGYDSAFTADNRKYLVGYVETSQGSYVLDLRPLIGYELTGTAAKLGIAVGDQVTVTAKSKVGTTLEAVSITKTKSGTSDSTDTGLKTYTNAQYGFSFQYPSDQSVKTDNYLSWHPFASSPVAYLSIPWHKTDGKSVDSAYLTINVSSDPTDVKNCNGGIHNIDTNIPPNQVFVTPSATATVQINGITFAQADYGAPNPAGLERNYSALHNGMCYDIQIFTIPSCSLCTNGPEPVSQHYDAMSEMDVFARTFRFTK
jgi:uncharacterized protein (UPF0333 family)